MFYGEDNNKETVIVSERKLERRNDSLSLTLFSIRVSLPGRPSSMRCVRQWLLWRDIYS